jgi:hypothetical protein
VSPDEDWLELKLPAPLARLANRPYGRYRLSCPVEFNHRGGEVAAQAETGTVQYEVSYNPAKDRWYLDAAWKSRAGPVPSLDQLRASPAVAVDVNAGHLAVAVLTSDGNVIGTPYTIPLQLTGLLGSTRDGRVRAAVSTLIATAKAAGHAL